MNFKTVFDNRKYLLSWFVPTVVLLLGVAFSIMIYTISYKRDYVESFQSFNIQAEISFNAVQRDIEVYLTILKSLRSFVSVYPNLSRSAFRTYTLPIIKNEVGLQAMAWLTVLTPSELPLYKEKAHKEGFPDFDFYKIMPDGKHAPLEIKDYYPIIYYIEPSEDNNVVLGLDATSTHSRFITLLKSIQTDKVATTGRIILARHNPGVVLFLPVYKSNVIPGANTGLKNISSLVNCAISFKGFIENALRRLNLDVSFYLFDASAEDTKEQLLYSPIDEKNDSRQSPQTIADAQKYPIFIEKLITVGDRQWMLFVTPKSYFYKHIWIPRIILLIGLLISFMLFVITRTIVLNLQQKVSIKVLEDIVIARTAEIEEERNLAVSASKMKSDFVANISHELRTPLNAIIGYTEMLLEEMEDAGVKEYSSDLNKVISSANHLLSLINDVLDLSKVEASKMDLFLEEVEIATLVTELKFICSPLIKKNKNTFEIIVAKSLSTMYTDVVRIRQSLLNLLSNASKFTKEGVITLDVKPLQANNKEWVRFSIRDTGIGIPPEKLKLLFQAFTQVDSSTTRQYGGTGLGLYLTKIFTTMLGGRITVESEKGKGTCFSLILPIKSITGISKAEISHNSYTATEIAVKGDAQTILIIDDEPLIHQEVQKRLEQSGYRVLHAFSGEEGISLARKCKPDLITLDILMPVMDGWSTLSALKSEPNTANIPVILITVISDVDIGYAIGAVDYLQKPIEQKSFIEKIKSVLKTDKKSHPILIVDDDSNVRHPISRAVKKAGWIPIEAANGIEALEHLTKIEPSLILLDLMMPEMDGFAIVKALQQNEKWRKIPVIIITAKDLSDEEHAMLMQHSKSILQKGTYSHREVIDLIFKEIKKMEEESNKND